ncbi:MAG: primosomal protein N', partial [Saprospiraceae bacterium]|nr:primosomal protein N' [Saprospiraceae bacterium]
RSDHQTRALLAIIQLSGAKNDIRLEEVLRVAEVTHQVIASLEKKGLVERFRLEISRIKTYDGDLEGMKTLSKDQRTALDAIERGSRNKPVLLHGVTGSGKTRIYIEEIKEALQRGQHVLYLLPEIALTTQIVVRLQKVFGDQLLVYHSKLNENERVEVWKKTAGLPHLILGARSSIFLPFADLGLIIVDEEHDSSYKQSDPNPRYQGRDSAIYLARLHECPIILGSATPSLESYYNAQSGKYTLVEMKQRYGEIGMPEVAVIDLKKRPTLGYFSRDLLDEIEETHRRGLQTILFQNRRGFAPIMLCTACGWNAMCKNCDTSLTYHKYNNQMQCHFCAYHETPALVCPACGNHELTLKGFGTELIEDDIGIRLPALKVGRLDLDTARGKKRLYQIIHDFEQGKLDVLIGTQMVTKGLDFENVGLVGIINADQLLHYPDFRATERAFQLMTQVSGRAGRRNQQGRVLIQAYQVSHPVVKEVILHDYTTFYRREIAERRHFGFPPFSRVIEVTLKHVKAAVVEKAARSLAQYMEHRLGKRVRGPVVPSVSRVRNKYLQILTIKLEKDAVLIRKTKDWLKEAHALLVKEKGMSTLRFGVNVDP